MLNKEQFLQRLESGIYHQHPHLCIRENTEWKPYPWQEEAMAGLFCGNKRKVIALHPAGTGKTTLLAMAAFYFFITRIPSMVIVLAPSIRQVTGIFFHYLNPIFMNSFIADMVLIRKNGIFLKDVSHMHSITYLSSLRPKEVEGMTGPDEGKNLLYLVDSVMSVNKDMLELIESQLCVEENFLLMVDRRPGDQLFGIKT